MSFGFSVGDFLAAGKLVAEIIGSLRDAGGAREEYQELIRELESLDRALKHVDRLSGPTADNIKCAALMCRYPLEEFRRRVTKPYERTLGVRSAAGIAESTKRKLQWTFGKGGDVAKLRDYLSIHIGIINMELLAAGLESLGSPAGSAVCQQGVHREMEQSRVALNNLDSRVQNQSSLVRAIESSVGSLLGIIRNDVLSSLKELLQAATNIFTSTQHVLVILLEIRSSLNGIQTQHTFFQPPVRVEDALGRVWPIPSEYSTADLHALVRSKFIGSPGQIDVETGNYEVFNQQNHRQIIVAGANAGLIPGMRVTMAVVLQSIASGQRACPVVTCRSSRSFESPGGGRKCERCGVYYRPTGRKRKRTLEEAEDVTDQAEDSAEGEEPPTKRPRVDTTSPSLIGDGDIPNALFKHILIPQKPADESLRNWTDRTGSFTVQAEFVGLSHSGKVCLHKANGARIRVAVRKMSLADLKYIVDRANVGLEKRDLDFFGEKIAPVRTLPTGLTRTWTDRSHCFTTEASFLGVKDGKLGLHKLTNGVKIAVPLSKISLEDLDYVRSTYGVQIEEEQNADVVC